MTKKCLRCGQEKEVCEFNKDKQKSNGLRSYCRECDSKEKKETREKRKIMFKNQSPSSEKLCKKCNVIKPASEFNRDYAKDTTLATYCKKCVQTFPSQTNDQKNKRKREWRQKNKEKNREKNRLQKKRDYERHKDERDRKSKEYYIKNREKILTKNKLKYKENKDIYSQKAKEYRTKNAEIIEQKKKEYYQRPEIRNHATQKSREWRRNNPEKRREMNRRYFKKDPIRKIIRNIRNRVFVVLKKIGTIKINHTIKMLDCSPKFLKEHLESQFYSYINEDGETINMSWDNFGNGHGAWQIDHIVALTLFNLNNKEEQLIANHWSNLQPLWFHDHILKSKLDLELKKDLNIN